MRKLIFMKLSLLLFFVPVLTFSKSLEEGQMIGSTTGRYALGKISSSRKDQYFLDTKTGETWRIIAVGDSESESQPMFVPVKFIFSDGLCAVTPEPSDKQQFFKCFPNKDETGANPK